MPRTALSVPLILTTALTGFLALPTAAQTPDYSKAERLLSWHASSLIAGDDVDPDWIAGSSRFWYRNKTGSGHAFVRVDPLRKTQGPLFDHARLAASMSLAADTSYEPHKLPFTTLELVRGETAISFRAGRRQFECDLRSYACTIGDTLPGRQRYVVSPDSAWEVFAKDYDLWLRPRGGGDSTRLTTDGEKYNAYGVGVIQPTQLLRSRDPQPQRPDARWSPDGRRILVTRTDERDVELMHYLSYTSTRPRHFEKPYALPGDSIIPITSLHVLDVGETIAALAQERDARAGDGSAADASTPSGGRTGARSIPLPANVRVELAPVPFRVGVGSSSTDSVWNPASDRVHLTAYTRGAKKLYLTEVDAVTGAQRILAIDSAKTNVIGQEYIEPKSWYVTENGLDVIWWSERDGWAHLWRFDANGNLKNRITSGAWTVGRIHRVDEARGQIWFIGRGREPGHNLYYGHLYRVNFDGSGLTLLTPEDANHDVEFSPDGAFFVDTYSRIEAAPVTVLRRSTDGSMVRELERADVSQLAGIGWQPARVFSVKARDGITDLWGVMYLPPNLDPAKKYPVIDHIYPGPFVGSVGSWSFKAHGENFALARLGFIVVQVDHLGTRYRSKAFHDNYYGDMGDNGVPDHVLAIRQLAVRHPYIDIERVGIYGHSGGGFASTDAILRFPDFYKVAVSGAGNHDQQTYGHYWGEVYQGLMQKDTVKGISNFDSQANRLFAGNLKGRLLLMHGDMDDNVHPAMTLQVINELIKANKDFDLIIAPDRGHGLNEPYFIRRRWDYFVRHLMGVEPPREYEIRRPAGG
ncbi:MAG: S9 family peptidase [Gemmatimonadetes bacterium]|nr:S9 family peptidase [Gemmatimonadota bacterium]